MPGKHSASRDSGSGFHVANDGYATEPEVVTLDPTVMAVMHRKVPMSELKAFFAEAFGATLAAAQAQGATIVGPAIGVYYGMPTDVVDVAAGFPTSRPISPELGVTSENLPGGLALHMLHRGPYSTLNETYDRLRAWFVERDANPGRVMWEAYLNDPSETDPSAAETLVIWTFTEKASTKRIPKVTETRPPAA